MNTVEFFSFRFPFEFKLILSYFSLIPKNEVPDHDSTTFSVSKLNILF